MAEDYDDRAYYEVQLNNKQLVFFFMAALAIAVVVFLCGVMVGRGVRDATLAASRNDIAAEGSKDAATESIRFRTERKETPRLDYAQRLSRDEVDTQLDAVRSDSPETTARQSVEPSPAVQQPVAKTPPPQVASTSPPPASPSPPSPEPAVIGADRGPFTIQVVALKTEDAARSLLTRLKGKRYRAYLEAVGDAGLHRVRVGRFETRAEAEQVAAKLRTEEKFRPYVTQ
ncbi:MAG TPA: SPOR domain-containing protein [Vicinamibacteria bacterium]|nr:SPOR domain-containing protein [Vicinamibacteria bacterium]